ncbi:TetR/AcrR family transcriptional regulator [Bordetella genomosp. 13]|uniref:TetR/AcrR family transcriptional regulator n=1 Tax=Bordetella genomosp. 13 TaxID=463040 RepID=UPI0011A194DC|nr:TetR/AcrR family transcriptional regulator [Bordetella genomosp. 13]
MDTTPELSPRAAEIAEHAKALLAIGGYNGFSYADISERVHIGKASIHHHFPSKAELVHTVVVIHREQARSGLASLDRQIEDPLARLNAYTGYWAQCIRENTAPICICAMLAAELPAIPSDIAHEVRGYFNDLSGWLASVIEQGAAMGKFQLQDEPAVEAHSFMASVHGAMLSARALGNAETFESITQAAIGRIAVPA